jgi:hypothetical protein
VRVLIQHHAHRDGVNVVHVVPGALAELSGKALDALEPKALEMIGGVVRESGVAWARLIEDANELPEPSRGTVHPA